MPIAERLKLSINQSVQKLIVTGSGKSHAQKFNSILFHKKIATLKTYPCTVPVLSNVNWSAFLEGILLTCDVKVKKTRPMT